MTTVAMVAGMLPIALGWGGDSDFRSPMAIAVIGGLITSTMLTLVIVPAVFTLFDATSGALDRTEGHYAVGRHAGVGRRGLAWTCEPPTVSSVLPRAPRSNRAFEKPDLA